MTEKELIERDSKRDLGAELLESVHQMKAGQKGATHEAQPEKVEVTIQISMDVLEYFQAMSDDWEQLIDESLKTYIADRQKLLDELTAEAQELDMGY